MLYEACSGVRVNAYTCEPNIAPNPMSDASNSVVILEFLLSEKVVPLKSFKNSINQIKSCLLQYVLLFHIWHKSQICWSFLVGIDIVNVLVSTMMPK